MLAQPQINQPSCPAEDALRQLFHNSPDAIIVLDVQTGLFVDCNAAAVSLVRARCKSDLLFKSPLEVSPPKQPDGSDTRTAVKRIIQQVQQRGSLRFEWLARRFDGALYYAEVVSTKVRQGKKDLHFILCRDITDRKATEQALRESEQKFRLLFENSSDAIMILDPVTQTWLACNDAAVRLSQGGTREWLLNQSFSTLAPERQPDGSLSSDIVDFYLNKARTEGTQRFEWTAKRFSGELFSLDTLLVPIQTALGLLMVTVSRDITERKKAEREIQELTQQLEMRVRDRTLELVQANEQLKAEVRQRRRKEKIQQALYQISQAVITAEDLDSLYHQIHINVQSLMPARNFYLALYDNNSDEFYFPYFRDEYDSPPDRMSASTGLTSYVLRSGKALLVNSRTPLLRLESGKVMLMDAGPEAVYFESGTPCKVWLGAPLQTRNQTIGVMALQDYNNESAYGEEEMQILSFVAEQTALAIERKRAEQALRESEEKHRALFEGTSQAVVLHDDKQFLEINPATLRVLGFDREDEILGHHPSEISAPIQSNGQPAHLLAQAYIQECLTKGSARFDWITRNSKGQDIPTEVFLTRISMNGRHIIQGVINDITERKKAEAELLKALAREKELRQLKTHFVSTVSHEFRTPLGIIMSSAQILSDYFENLTAEERKEHLLSITHNTRHMANLMEEVLLLSRAESGKLAFEPGPLDISTFFDRIIEEVLSSATHHCPIQLSISITNTIQADERLLRHIFTNLLSNAVKYSMPGSPVELSVHQENDDLVGRIADHGIGIPEADRPWLFQPFHRARNVGDRPGSGLGLMIVKRCVELHGGRICIDPNPGGGSVATVRLPLRPHATPPSHS